MDKITVDAIGEACPLPVVKAKRAFESMHTPGILEVYVDNEAAVQNLLRLAESAQLKAVSESTAKNRFSVRMEVAAPMKSANSGRCGNQVVAVGSASMGQGDEALGTLLMKGFLYALTELSDPPATVLFYNGGAKLTSADSASLDDLRALESRGVEILTCGTCLNFYGLSDKLSVGGVTNMYTIVEKLAGADTIIKP